MLHYTSIRSLLCSSLESKSEKIINSLIFNQIASYLPGFVSFSSMVTSYSPKEANEWKNETKQINGLFKMSKSQHFNSMSINIIYFMTYFIQIVIDLDYFSFIPLITISLCVIQKITPSRN